MLLITAYRGETTTISTPSGDVISIAIKGSNNNQFVVGIDAPDEYIILRSKLRERIIRGISHYPAFIVSSTRHSRWAVVARNESQAIAYYHKKYPDSMAIQAEQIECLLNEPWFERLVAAWPRHSDPPVGVMLL